MVFSSGNFHKPDLDALLEWVSELWTPVVVAAAAHRGGPLGLDLRDASNGSPTGPGRSGALGAGCGSCHLSCEGRGVSTTPALVVLGASVRRRVLALLLGVEG